MFDEVHGYGIPWPGRYRKLFEKSVWFMAGRLGPLARSTRVAIVLDEVPHTWPYIFPSNEFHSLVLAEVSRKWVIVLVLENAQAQVGYVRNVYSIVLKE
jgi:hypothetical protein